MYSRVKSYTQNSTLIGLIGSFSVLKIYIYGDFEIFFPNVNLTNFAKFWREKKNQIIDINGIGRKKNPDWNKGLKCL